MGSVMRTLKALGLVEDGNPSQRQQEGPAMGSVQPRPDRRPQVRPVSAGAPAEPPPPGQRFAEAAPSYRSSGGSGYGPDLSVVVRPGEQAASVVSYTETIEARGFDDAKRIADLLRERMPVIVNLRDLEPTMVRRLVDFSSGLVYALDGSIRKVAEGVLLVSPPRVKIVERELRRLSDLGLYDLDS